MSRARARDATASPAGTLGGEELYVVALPRETYERLRLAAEAGGRTVTDEIQAALRGHLERAGRGGPRRLDEGG